MRVYEVQDIRAGDVGWLVNERKGSQMLEVKTADHVSDTTAILVRATQAPRAI